MDRREAIKNSALIMGGCLFAPSVMGVLKGCTARPGVDWNPQFFSREEALLVESITDVILPAGEVPGAKELGVPAFVEEMVHEVYDEGDKLHFMDGLHTFDERAKEQYDKSFNELDAEQQYEFAMEQHREALEGDSFFLVIKELTLLGFFTTEVGATQVLQYSQTPGRLDNCAPLDEVGRTWVM